MKKKDKTTNLEDTTTKIANNTTDDIVKNTKKKNSSDKNDINTTDLPWSVRGVAFETRSYIAKAAKKENKKLGEWINEKLLIAAQEVILKKDDHPIVKIEDMEMIQKINMMENNQLEQNTKIDQLTALVDNLVKNQSSNIFSRLFKLK